MRGSLEDEGTGAHGHVPGTRFLKKPKQAANPLSADADPHPLPKADRQEYADRAVVHQPALGHSTGPNHKAAKHQAPGHAGKDVTMADGPAPCTASVQLIGITGRGVLKRQGVDGALDSGVGEAAEQLHMSKKARRRQTDALKASVMCMEADDLPEARSNSAAAPSEMTTEGKPGVVAVRLAEGNCRAAPQHKQLKKKKVKHRTQVQKAQIGDSGEDKPVH